MIEAVKKIEVYKVFESDGSISYRFDSDKWYKKRDCGDLMEYADFVMPELECDFNRFMDDMYMKIVSKNNKK